MSHVAFSDPGTPSELILESLPQAGQLPPPPAPATLSIPSEHCPWLGLDTVYTLLQSFLTASGQLPHTHTQYTLPLLDR